MAKRRSKKYLEALAKIDKDIYTPQEAISLVKEVSTTSFDGTVEVHIRLGVDPRHADQMVRGSVVLPHGTGKERRVLVFALGDKVKEALDAGADYAGGEDLIKKVESGWLEFDAAIATPDIMSQVGRLGRLLGPRGLMPNPRTGTVTFEVAKAVREYKAGRVEFRMDRTGIIHVGIGKVSFDSSALLENFAALMDAVMRAKPQAVKGHYIKTVHIAPTMGPSIEVNPVLAVQLAAA
jgi:large subunit ribosomal protein L1